MKINFRKISAVAASLIMTGMSAGFAAAANYPAPFVEAGVANAAIVSGTGTGVSALDAVEAGNIQANLNAGVTSTSSTITGDAVQLDKSSDHINLGDALNGPFGSTVDDSDLDLLKDVVYTAKDSDTFDAEQRVTLGSPKLSHFRDSDYENLAGLSEKTPILGINISDGQFIMNYTLEFLDDAESDVVSSELDDLEGSFLPLLGKQFYISDWDNGTSNNQAGKLTLLDAAVSGSAKEGEVTSVTLKGVKYDVSVAYVDADSTKLTVNGQTTNMLLDGETAKLTDGTYLGITEIAKLEVGGEIGTVDFSLGAGKLELTHASEIQLNGDTISDMRAYMRKTAPTSGVEKIDYIAIEWKAEDELFITPNSEVSMPGLGGLKFSMTDFARSAEDKITITGDSDTNVKITLPIKDGTATIPLLYGNASGDFVGIGKNHDDRLITSPTNRLTYWQKKNNLDYHRYFVATYNDSDSAESYLLELKPREEVGVRNETDVLNKVSGVTEASDKKAGDTVKIGDVSFDIEFVHVNSTDKYVNITAGTNTNFNTVFSLGGLKVWLPYDVSTNVTNSTFGEDGSLGNVNTLFGLYGGIVDTAIGAINFTNVSYAGAGGAAGHGWETYYLSMAGEDKDDNLASGRYFAVRLDPNSDGDIEVDQVNTSVGGFAGSGGPTGKEQGTTAIYEAYVVSDVAPKVLHYTKPDRDYAEVYYPTGASESYAKVFLTDIGATSVPEGGAVLVKDTEVSSVATKNLIIVGGSCINSAAATL
ncbi:hypothetical protein HYT91_03045, partial [Candidatus Pacearchaeota archaeon]|nr:hypothetical protein [Candidatus Pacearchaeota archaeon]